MIELRRDDLSGEWVAVSTVRAERPFVFEDSGTCPFCPQNAHMTPPEVYRNEYVRVFPNKYPALAPTSPEGYGYHEILVDTDNHTKKLHAFTETRIVGVFQGLQHRMRALAADERIRYIQVFKNEGLAAGASLGHSHWQILGLPEIPPKQQQIRHGFDEYLRLHGYCCLCVRDSLATVAEDKYTVAYVPYASAFADGVNLMPWRHVSDFAQLTDAEYASLAGMLKSVLTALSELHPGIGYNLCIQNGTGASSHVYLQVIPRLGNFAGLELATGCFINSVDPAETVRRFREQME